MAERLSFVRFWADYIKRTPNEIWSKQYVMLINSVMLSASKDAKLYLKVKGTVERAKKRSLLVPQ